VWLKEVKRGIDPKVEIAKERAAALRVKKFGEVLEAWLKHDVDQHTSGKQTRQLFEREIPKEWLNRPLADIRKQDIAKLIRGIVKRGYKPTANNMFGSRRRH
jgi:hypothetical protein